MEKRSKVIRNVVVLIISLIIGTGIGLHISDEWRGGYTFAGDYIMYETCEEEDFLENLTILSEKSGDMKTDITTVYGRNRYTIIFKYR